jgi:hypothetical protein
MVLRFLAAAVVVSAVGLLAVGCRPEATPHASRTTPRMHEPSSSETSIAAAREAAPATSASVLAQSTTQAADAGASLVALPKKCAAESPVDAPCNSFGGTYRIRVAPRDGAKEKCVVAKAIDVKVTIDGSTTYRGRGQAEELEALGRSLGLTNPDLRVGAAVRDGVCCLDLDLSDGKDVERRVKLHLARGATKVNAKAQERRVAGSDFCDGELAVEAELVR